MTHCINFRLILWFLWSLCLHACCVLWFLFFPQWRKCYNWLPCYSQPTSAVSSTLRARSCWCAGTRPVATCRSSGPTPTWTRPAASPGCTAPKTRPWSVTLCVSATPSCPSGTRCSTTRTPPGNPSWGENWVHPQGVYVAWIWFNWSINFILCRTHYDLRLLV